jgi:hypothetical protein
LLRQEERQQQGLVLLLLEVKRMESEPDNMELQPVATIRVETALSRYPVHRLARKGTIEINIQQGKKNGQETRWEVDYSKKHGQPGPLAYKLDTLIINRRIEESPRPLPKTIRLGSLKEICRELGMAETGGNTNQIKTSLYQNALAGINAKTRYKLNDGTEQTLEAVFTRYSVILTGEKFPDGRKADAVYVVLNDLFMQIINGAMTRPLDYDYLKSLPPAPQRFYEILSYQMYAALRYDRPRAKLTYSELCSHAPLTRHSEWENVRSQLNKIHRPHRQSGYITQVEIQQTTDGRGMPDWVMLYQPGPKARAEYRAFTKRGGPTTLKIDDSEFLPPTAMSEQSETERQLIRRGVTGDIARELVCDHSEEKITAQMERLDWLVEKKPRKIEDPAAYLVQAIKNDYAAPKGFVSLADRRKREETKRAAEHKTAELRRRKQEETRRENEERKAADVEIERLTPDERTELEAELLAQADPETRRSHESRGMAPFRETLMLMMLRQHFAEKRNAGQVAAEA